MGVAISSEPQGKNHSHGLQNLKHIYEILQNIRKNKDEDAQIKTHSFKLQSLVSPKIIVIHTILFNGIFINFIHWNKQ